MAPPSDRSKSTRRRIAGERSGLTVGGPALAEVDRHEAPGYDEDTTQRASPVATSQQPRWTVSVPTTAQAPAVRRPVSGPPRWVLVTLAGLLVAALALDALVVWRGVVQRNAEEDTARALHSAVIQAPSVAEKAAEPLLSYRYDTIDKDLAEARTYLSDGYLPQYTSAIEKLVAAPAADIRATVKAEVLSSGVVEASGDRSDVLLFVNQTTTSATSEPRTALNRVVMTMVRRDGSWIVDEIRAL